MPTSRAWGDGEVSNDDSEPLTPLSVTQSIDMLLDTIFEDPYEGLHAADDMHRPPDRPHNFLFKHTCNQAHVGAPLPPITVLVLLPWAFSRLGVVLAAGTVIVTVLVSHAANMMLHARRAHTSRMGWNTRRSKAMLHWTVALFGCAAAALCTLCAVDILIGNGLLPGLVQDMLYGHASEQPAAATSMVGQHLMVMPNTINDSITVVADTPQHPYSHRHVHRVHLPDWALSRQLWIIIIILCTLIPMSTPRIRHAYTSSSAITTIHHLATIASTTLLAALGVLLFTSWCVQGQLAPLCLLPGCGLAPRPWTVLPPWADTALQAAALSCVILGGLLQAHVWHLAALQLPTEPSRGGLYGGMTGHATHHVAAHVPHPASWMVVGGWAVAACVAGVGGYCVFGLWVADNVLVSFNVEDLIPLAGPHWLALGVSVLVKTIVLCSLITSCPTWFALARHHVLRAACGANTTRGSYQSLSGPPLEGPLLGEGWDSACGRCVVAVLHVVLVGGWWGIAAGGQALQVVAALMGGLLGEPLLLVVPAGIAWRSGGWGWRVLAVVLGVLGVLMGVVSVTAVVLS